MIDKLLKFSGYLDKIGKYEQSDKLFKFAKNCLLKFALDANDLRNVYLMEVIPNEIIVQDEGLFQNMFVEIRKIWKEYVYNGLTAILDELRYIYEQDIKNDKFEETFERLSKDPKYIANLGANSFDSGDDRRRRISEDACKILEKEKERQLKIVNNMLIGIGLDSSQRIDSRVLTQSNWAHFANNLPTIASLFKIGFTKSMFGGNNWANIADALSKIYIFGKSFFQSSAVFNQRSIADLKKLMYFMDRFNDLSHNSGLALGKMVDNPYQINDFLNMKGIASVPSLMQYESRYENSIDDEQTPEQISKTRRRRESKTPKWLSDAITQWMRVEKRNRMGREDALREVLSNPKSDKFRSFIRLFRENIEVREKTKSDIFDIIDETDDNDKKEIWFDNIVELNTNNYGQCEYDENLLQKYLELYDDIYRYRWDKLFFSASSPERSAKAFDSNIKILEKITMNFTPNHYYNVSDVIYYVPKIVFDFVRVAIYFNQEISKPNEFEKMKSVLSSRLVEIKNLLHRLNDENIQEIVNIIYNKINEMVRNTLWSRKYLEDIKNIIFSILVD